MRSYKIDEAYEKVLVQQHNKVLDQLVEGLLDRVRARVSGKIDKIGGHLTNIGRGVDVARGRNAQNPVNPQEVQNTSEIDSIANSFTRDVARLGFITQDQMEDFKTRLVNSIATIYKNTQRGTPPPSPNALPSPNEEQPPPLPYEQQPPPLPL